MGVIAYSKEVSPGQHETLYMVVVEAVNKYTGKRVQKKRRGIPSKPKAERVWRELWNACREERPDGVNFTNWDQLAERYLSYVDSNLRSETNPLGFSLQVVRSKKSLLGYMKEWNGTHLDLITPQFVTEWLDALEKCGKSRSITNHVLKDVKCAFAYALHLGAIKTNLFAGMKMRRMPKKRKEALTHNEVNQLLLEARKRQHPYYEIWLLTIALGLRRSELAGLQWLDIEFEQGLAFIRRQIIPGEGLVPFPKDREERIVAIPSHVMPVLKEMKLRSTSDFVIEVDCSKWREGQQAEVLRNFCREIGIKEVTHHQLRATHITLALVDGVPLGIVKQNVGHAKLSTTDEYFRSSGIEMKGQMDGLRVPVPPESEAVILPLNSTAK